MFSSDLRRYLLEIIAKYEIQYFGLNINNSDNKDLVKKMMKDIENFVNRFNFQLQDFPNALNILRNYEDLIEAFNTSEDIEDKIIQYQRIVLEFLKNVSQYLKNIFRTHLNN